MVYDILGDWQKETETLSADTTDYHNPADVEVLRKARKALLSIFRENASQESMEFAEHVIEAIDKVIGGGQNV